MNDNLGISELILEIRGWKAGTSDDSRRMVWLMNKAADEIERLWKERDTVRKAAIGIKTSVEKFFARVEKIVKNADHELRDMYNALQVATARAETAESELKQLKSLERINE